MKSFKKIIYKVIRIISWVIGIIVLILIIVIIAIQLPSVQNFAKNKVIAYLEDKLKTKVEIEELRISFPKTIVLKNIYLEDQDKDTLLYGNTVLVDISMFQLLNKTVDVSRIQLHDIRANIYRKGTDTAFNFSYIIDAFAANEEIAKPSDSSSSFSFKPGTVELEEIRVAYKDDLSGNDVHFYLNYFKTKIDEFDPGKSVYSIPEIMLSGIDASVKQYKPLVEPKSKAEVESESNEPVQAILHLDKLDIDSIRFNYENDISKLNASLNLGRLHTNFKQIDLSKLAISLDDLQLDNTLVKVVMDKTEQSAVAAKEIGELAEAQVNNPWQFSLENISFNNNELQFENNNDPVLKTGVDYSHLHIRDFNMQGDRLDFTPTIFKGNISNLSFTEKSGLNLKKLQTGFQYSDQQVSLQNLLVQTDKSFIKSNLQVTYPSLYVLQKNTGEAYINTNLDNCSIAVKDILLFAPAFGTSLKNYSGAVININAVAKGYIKNINIASFEVNGLGTASLNMQGNIKGLPDAKSAYYDLQLRRLMVSRKDLINLLPANTLPASVRVPEKAELTGYFKGSYNNFSSQANLKSSNGDVAVKGNASLTKESYHAEVIMRNANIGYILKQDSLLGNISGEVAITGSGFNYKKMNTNLTVHLLDAEIKNYHYKDVNLVAILKDDSAMIESFANDPNINYKLHAEANLKNAYPAVQFQLTADTINLHALHLVKDSIKFSGIMYGDFLNTNPDTLEGALHIANAVINYNGRSITTDSLALIASRPGDSIQLISLVAEMAKMKLEGQYKLTEMATALQHTINKYYHIPGFKDTAFTPQEWNLQLHAQTSPLILEMMPALKGTDSLQASMFYKSSSNEINIQANAPLIQYDDQKIENLNLQVLTENNQLKYAASVSKAGQKGFQLYETSLAGYVKDSLITASLLLKDKNDKMRYRLAGGLQQPSQGIRFSLYPDSLMLNYDNWQVTEDNFIQYDSSGIIAHNFNISHDDQALQINSQALSAQAPLEIVFNHFRIKTLTEFADQDSLLVDGTIDGNAIVKNATNSPSFTSDLLIKDLSYKKDTLGNLTIKASNESPDTFNAQVKIEGNQNDVELSGKYYTKDNRMDMKLDIVNINMATIPPLSAGQLKDAGGSLKGTLNIAGTMDKPAVNGNLGFHDAFIIPAFLGARFSLKNEKIDVSEKGITFNEFTIGDSIGNKAIINGNIITGDYRNYSFDLTVNGDDFTVINAAKTSNALLYGKMNMDANIKIGGTASLPDISGKILVNKATNVTFVLPSENPEIQSREGVVNFIDFDHPDTTAETTINLADSIRQAAAAISGIKLDAIIETDTAAVFTLVIDELSGDALEVKGKASLAAGMDESGKLSLTGNYELQQGSYQISFNFLKRKFIIQKGSVLTWTGDPTSANVNIIALYDLKAAPIDLVESSLAGMSVSEINRYKQRIPVQVFLKMEGELLKPQISFQISLPKEEASKWPVVKSKLEQLSTDESELNKQVFALLLLNRFVGDDLLQSQAGSTSTSTLIRQSVSSILTDQLNRLADNLILGVDLNFGIESEDDYTTGSQQTRTDLTVGVSKSLLNDRIKVTVGSNFELEGPSSSNQPASNIAGDITVDYQLSKDGRYMLRAYRKNKYEAVIEGEIIETGLTFIFTLDYDHFKELFQKKKDKQQNKRSKK